MNAIKVNEFLHTLSSDRRATMVETNRVNDSEVANPRVEIEREGQCAYTTGSRRSVPVSPPNKASNSPMKNAVTRNTMIQRSLRKLKRCLPHHLSIKPTANRASFRPKFFH